MTRVFISHSSKDSAAAVEVCARLQAADYQSVFLDFDPASGIPAGRDWEQELYSRLKSCDGLVALLSEEFARSRWCFAEVALARLLGKAVFPVRLSAGAPIDGVLQRLQIIDLVEDAQHGYRRLLDGLAAAGLDPRDDFGWHVSGSPYPGLRPFEEEDAGVFFGREEEIKSVLEALARMRQIGDSRMAVVLGASGSGKSSLVRAGVLPRIKKDPGRWFTLPPMRPKDRPLRALAAVVARVLHGEDDGSSRREVEEALRAVPDEAGSRLVELVTEGAEAAGRDDATPVLVVDQFEELFAAPTDGEGSWFRQLLAQVLQMPRPSFLVVITLRSDFLGQFQSLPELAGSRFESIPVGPMPIERFETLIEGPAERTDPPLVFESGLVDRIVEDTGTNDALPLLAFTLRELYERRDGSGSITLGSYLELGGIQGSVARAANALVADGRLSAAEESALKTSFLRLVQINDEGQFARRPARRDELPAESLHLVDSFVKARLLTSSSGDEGEPRIEIAHESLLRVWDRFTSWLEEAREFLLWRNRFRAPFEQWRGSDRRTDALLVGASLVAAERWRRERPDGLSEDERAFIDDSLLRRRREERRRKVALYGSIAAAVSFLALSFWAVAQKQEAERQSEIALIRQLVADSDAISRPEIDWLRVKILLASEAVVRSRNLGIDESEAVESLRRYLRLVPQSFGSFGVGRATAVINDVGFSEDGSELVAASEYVDLHSRRWTFPQAAELPGLEIGGKVGAVALDPLAKYVAVANDNGVRGTARVFEVATGRQVGSEIPYEASVGDLALSPNADFLALSDKLRDNRTRVWRVSDQSLLLDVERSSTPRFSPDGGFFALGSRGARIWSIETGDDGIARFEEDAGARRLGTTDDVSAFSRDGKYVAYLGYHGVDILRSGSQIETARLPVRLTGRVLTLGPAADYLAVAPRTSGSSTALDIVRVAPFARVTIDHPGQVQDLAFSPDGRFLAVGSIGGSGVAVWRLESGGERTRITSGRNFLQAAFDAPAGLLIVLEEASSYVDGVMRRRIVKAWDIVHGNAIDIPNQLLASSNVTLSPDGRLIAVGTEKGVEVLHVRDGLPKAFSVDLDVSDSAATFAFSSTGEQLAIASKDTVRLFGVESRRESPRSDFEPFDYEGRAVGLEETATGWRLSVDIAPRAPRPARPTRRPPPRHVPKIVVWNLRTGEPVTEEPGSNDTLDEDAQGRATVATSIDGRYRAIREGGTITIYDRDEDLIAEVCRLAPDYAFTAEEAEHYLGDAEPMHGCMQ